MLIYLIFIFSIYFGFLCACIVGWKKFICQSPSLIESRREFVSVVIAMRNEESAISFFLDSLRFQDFAHQEFEVIFVDDHSSDRTAQLVLSWMKENPHVQSRYALSPGDGKKQALTKGIHLADGEIILTTDADCTLPMDWISTMVKSFDSDTTMVIGAVKIQPATSFFSKLQALEFSSLIGSGLALSTLGFSVLCNGASLAFRKKSFEVVNGYEGNLHIASGDDEFLMRKLAHYFPGSIRPVQWPGVVVSTLPQASLTGFIQQRLRWAGKWKANDSWMTRSLAVFILIFQISNIIAFSLFFTGTQTMEVGILIGLKFLAEGYFLFRINRTLHQRFFIKAFLLLQLAYPFYVVIIGMISQLLDYEWKGRSVKVIG